MITRTLRQEGWRVNFKRIYRIWRREGLKVPRKKATRRPLGTSDGGIVRRKATHRNHVWSIDFIFDRTTNGRPLKAVSLLDEFTRECVALEVDHRFTGDDVVELLVQAFAQRGISKFIRSDNGPEFVSRRVQEFLGKISIGTSYITPRSPWENGDVESFHSRLRDECLACEEFTTLAEAQIVIGRWRDIYNQRRPHSGIGGMTPAIIASNVQQQPEPKTTRSVPS